MLGDKQPLFGVACAGVLVVGKTMHAPPPTPHGSGCNLPTPKSIFLSASARGHTISRRDLPARGALAPFWVCLIGPHAAVHVAAGRICLHVRCAVPVSRGVTAACARGVMR